MRRRVGWVFAVGALLVVAACSDGGGSDEASPTTEASRATTTTSPVAVAPARLVDRECDTIVDLPTECYWLEVPERRDVADADTIRLWVAVLTPEGAPAGGVPWTYLSGGPGEANSTGWVHGTAGLAEDSPPLVIVDQRGTGRSEPRLGCPELDVRDDADLPYAERVEVSRQKAQRCAAALRSDGIDLDGYDSVESAADFVALREALGYEQWDLYGLSYGARLAREIQRRDPGHVRRMHLDSPATSLHDGPAARVARTEQVLQGVADACAAQPACAADGPLLENIDTAYAALEADPYRTTLEDGSELVVDGEQLVSGVRQLLYDTSLIPVLPSAAAAIARGDRTLLGTLGEQLAAVADDPVDRTAQGLTGAMTCADDPGLTDDDRALLDDPGRWGFVVGGDVCDAWGVTPVDTGAGPPSDPDVPVLLTLGEFDPVAPPGTEDEIEAAYPNTTVVSLPGGGHVVAFVNECMTAISYAFRAGADGVPDTTCADGFPPAFAPEG